LLIDCRSKLTVPTEAGDVKKVDGDDYEEDYRDSVSEIGTAR